MAKVSAKVPDSLKYKDGTTKWLLRDAFRSILPQTTAERAKLGFPTPIKHWLSRDPQWFRDTILGNEYIATHFDTAEIRKLFDQHADGTAENARKIYLLLMLALWYDTFIAVQEPAA